MAAGSMDAQGAGQHLILYDGLCGLCNRMNRFVLPRDRAAVFAFASLQSRVGREVVERFGHNPDDLDTFFLIVDYRSESARALTKSTAALFVVRALGAPWSWIAALVVLPRTLRDWTYDLIARNRYRLFGRFETCLMPTADYKRRFIDV
jgi:predicted DCC family thiol-disulfide oxidoreductase YuxK